MRKTIINTILALLLLAGLAFTSTDGFESMSGFAALCIAFPPMVAAAITLVKLNTDWL